MNLLQRSARALCVLSLCFLAGCGSSSENQTVPTTISTFYQHSALFRNHTTMTAGYNAFGQLGDNSLNNRALFQPVTAAGLSHVDGVAVGGVHTLAFKNHSSVYAWGSNSSGQLGANVAAGAGLASKVPVRVVLADTTTPLVGVTSVAAGSYHSLAISNGQVYAWGDNAYGQLGDGTTSASHFPKLVVGSFQGTVSQIAAGGLDSYALTADGHIWGWGNNDFGQLGPLGTVKSSSSAPTLLSTADATGNTPPSLAQGFSAIAAGGSFVVAIAKADSTVWAWGLNNYGQLGRLPVGASALPFSARPLQIMMADGVTSFKASKVVAGTNHVVALGLDDNNVSTGVWAWGLNYYGQLGNNNKAGQSFPGPDSTTLFLYHTPVQVVTSATAGGGSGTPISNITDIIAFGFSSFALTADNKLYAWGANIYGQLGFADRSKLGYQENPILVPGF